MIARYKKPNAENSNRNDFVNLRSRRVGNVYKVYATHSVATETKLRKGVKEFGSMKEVYEFFDRMEAEMSEKGWIKNKKR